MDRSERLGLGVSTAGHVLLFGALSLGLLQTAVEMPPHQPTIDVSFADEVALESRTNLPATEAPQIAEAPEVGDYEPEAAPPEPADTAPAAPLTPAPLAEVQPKPRAIQQPAPPKPRSAELSSSAITASTLRRPSTQSRSVR